MGKDMVALSVGQIGMLILFAVMLAAGQLLFKMASTTSDNLRELQGLLSLAGNPWFWIALILYGVATLLWLVILQRVPLSTAYPFVALGFVIVPLGAWALYGEPLALRHLFGTALIIGGLIVISR